MKKTKSKQGKMSQRALYEKELDGLNKVCNALLAFDKRARTRIVKSAKEMIDWYE